MPIFSPSMHFLPEGQGTIEKRGQRSKLTNEPCTARLNYSVIPKFHVSAEENRKTALQSSDKLPW